MKQTPEKLFKLRIRLIFFAILILNLLTGCQGNATPSLMAPSETATKTLAIQETHPPTQIPTRRPTATATNAPLGTGQNPIRFGFVISEDQSQAVDAANEIAFLIENDTGYHVESQIFANFSALASAIENGEVHLFWLMPLEYLYLNWEGQAQIFMMSNHLGVYAYGVQFMANSLRGFTSDFDLELNASTGNPTESLQQFAGTRPCFTDPNSLPGTLTPLGLLANTSTPTLAPVFTYDYSATIRALYVQGICDFGIGYAHYGDPRTGSDVLNSFPDVQTYVVTIWQSPPIIPNLGLAASPSLPLHLRVIMQESMMDLVQNKNQQQILSTALAYEVAALKPITDQFYNPLRDTLLPLNLDLADMLLTNGETTQ